VNLEVEEVGLKLIRKAKAMFSLSSCPARVLVAGLLVQAGFAQSTIPSPPEQISTGYVLGNGDTLRVTVLGVADYDYTLQIDSSGSLLVPLVGELKVAGQTAAQTQSQIQESLKALELIRDPQVSVLVVEFQSKPISVLGMVNQPGSYQLTRSMHLVDVLALAGGVNEEIYTPKAIIQRAGAAGEVLEIDLDRLLNKAEASLNVPIRGGDIVSVPKQDVRLFYVIGDVVNAGGYEIPKEGSLLVTQAVARAGGPARTAKPKDGRLLRYGEGGERQEIVFNLENIIEGKSADFSVRPNDVIFVPGSKVKTLGWGLLEAVPRIISDLVIFSSVR
jgi:polysaccharide export outer membrane protein